MADYFTNDEELTAVADAIREKTGGNEPLRYEDGFVGAIRGIQTATEAINDNVIGTSTTWSSQKINTELGTKIPSSQKGVANGVATLDAQGKLPASQLPSVADDDVFEYTSRSNFPANGVAAKIYVAKDTGFLYTWNGTTYVTLVDDSSAATNKVWSASKVSGELTDLEETVTESMEDLEETLSAEISRLDGTKADSDNLYAYKTAGPGSVVEVYDAVAEAVKTMQIEIAPVQDLHGYSKPWVGGAGKNIWDKTTYYLSPGYYIRYANGTSNGGNQDYCATLDYIPVPSGYEGQTIYSNFTIGGSSTGMAFYDEEKVFIEGSGVHNFPATVPTGAKFMRVTVNATDRLNDLIITFSSDTSYEPYSNICPISGFTGCEVTRDGANLIDPSLNTYDKYIDTEGSIKTSNGGLYYTGLIPVVPGENYIVDLKDEINTTSGASGRAVSGYKADGTFDSRIWSYNVQPGMYDRITDVVTIPSGVYFVRLNCNKNAGSSTFYMGDTYTITFPDGQTVYGGTLTVNADGTGTLVVDKAISILNGSETWSISATASRRVFRADNVMEVHAIHGNTLGKWKANWAIQQTDNASMSAYTANPSMFIFRGQGDESKNIFVATPTDGADMTLEQFEGMLSTNPLQIYYPLATSVPISLTAPQIRTILGYNRIYANTGSILSMLYPAEKYQTAEQAEKERIHAVVDESSAVVSITDGADNVPMGMQIAIEPVQDLHGYEYPWVGGAGKNLIPDKLNGNVSNITSDGLILTIVNGKFHLSGTANAAGTRQILKTETFTLKAGTYTLSKSSNDNCIPAIQNSNNDVYVALAPAETSKTYTFVSDTEVMLGFNPAAIGTEYGIAGVDFSIQLESGSSATSYAPYSNICPITGWTGAEITRTGKNLFDPNGELRTWYNPQNQKINGNTTKSVLLSATEGTAYTLSNKNVSSGSNVFMIAFLDANGNLLSRNVEASGAKFITKTAVANTAYVLAGFNYWAGVEEAQFEKGSEATAYEPFGQTYSITFPSSAGTVYGGTLTVNKDGTGVLTVDKKSKEYSSGWFMASSVMLIDDLTIPFDSTVYSCNQYPCNPNALITAAYIAQNYPKTVVNQHLSSGGNHTRWLIYDTKYANADEFNAYIAQNPIQVVYTLVTPITYILSAPVVRSLLGTNNLWADTGKVLKLDYTQDTKMYIDSLFASLSPAEGVSF